jgi:glycosyltransferase involved in cell wall biosynthesis
LVSVVIPCHNYARFLGQAIESALHQTYQPIEILVVDDGSTDDTSEVALRYPVKLLVQPQEGVCGAVNNGIRASQGTFVMRLDADDVLEPTYVEETLAALNRSPAAHFAYTEVAYFGAAAGTYPVEDFHPESLAERNYIHASALMRHAAFERLGGYDQTMAAARCEDWDLWLTFAEHDLPGVLVRKPLLRYRQHVSGGRNRLAWGALSTWKRNVSMAKRLRANHPRLFGSRALVRRLARLPGRLLRGDASPRFALLLVSLYGVMLLHSGMRLCVKQPSAAAGQSHD